MTKDPEKTFLGGLVLGFAGGTIAGAVVMSWYLLDIIIK